MSGIYDGQKKIVLDGEHATCGNCKGAYKMLGTGKRMIHKGRNVVLDGDRVLCPSGKNRVIVGSNPRVFVMNYGSPYLKGVAIRQNPETHAGERIYFAEKALPRWLYLGDNEMCVVIPNIGHETSKKYLIYRYVAGKRQSQESGSADRLPVTKRGLFHIE